MKQMTKRMLQSVIVLALLVVLVVQANYMYVMQTIEREEQLQQELQQKELQEQQKQKEEAEKKAKAEADAKVQAQLEVEAQAEAKEQTEKEQQVVEQTGFSVESLNAATNFSKIFIAHTSYASATQGTFDYYEKVNGLWQKQMSCLCYVGKAGIGAGSEYSTRTPAGIYTFTKLFGIAGDPGTLLPYQQLDDNDYWCGESNYNQFVDEDVQEHNCSRTNDEHLAACPSYYQYCAAFSYNTSNAPGQGFAFFLHNAGPRVDTDGCVAIPMSNMQHVMQSIDSGSCLIIDTDSNISNY